MQSSVIKKFIIKKVITSSDILTSAIDLVGSGVGELTVDDIILKTDSTGLAAGTNIEIETTNANGLADVMVETVANLGANKTVNLSAASVTGIKTVIEDGKKLTIKSTVAACTGAGKLYVYLYLSRASANGEIYG